MIVIRELRVKTVVNQIVIGIWKYDYEIWKFETQVVLNYKLLFIIIPIFKFRGLLRLRLLPPSESNLEHSLISYLYIV